MADSTTDLSKGVERLARLGYAAKGILYFVIGLYAAMTVLGISHDTAGTREAILAIARQPFGMFLVILLGIGLLGHVLWRMVQAFGDPEKKGRGVKGMLRRLGMFISGSIYLTTALFTLKLMLYTGSGSGSSPEAQGAEILSLAGGVYLLAAVGIGFIGVGVYQIWRAYRETYRRHWQTRGLSRFQYALARLVGRVGLPARAVLFLIIGFYLCNAARTADPGKVRDLEGALAVLAKQPLGEWLLGAVAVGVICYASYCFCTAWLRRIKPEDA